MGMNNMNMPSVLPSNLNNGMSGNLGNMVMPTANGMNQNNGQNGQNNQNGNQNGSQNQQQSNPNGSGQLGSFQLQTPMSPFSPMGGLVPNLNMGLNMPTSPVGTDGVGVGAGQQWGMFGLGTADNSYNFGTEQSFNFGNGNGNNMNGNNN